MGANDGPRVRIDTFEPFSDADARKMSREQLRFCRTLSEDTKNMIRSRVDNVFKYGKAILAIVALPPVSLDSFTRTCQSDPFFCADTFPNDLQRFQDE